ncbi:MAG: putative zinc-binding metallopeptidase [Solirubrobacteraceae bacterium]|nr:putative zinc-binding metallopeptidase [Solirubrobacteraceae bacterium]
MRVFACGRCGRRLYFENSSCLACGAEQSFDPDAQELVVNDGSLPRCVNAQLIGCNWLADGPGRLCRSCALTAERPPADDEAAIADLVGAEAAKRWLLFQLAELGLPVESATEREGGLEFRLLSSAYEHVTTGHASGVITLDLAEVDDAHREEMRAQMGEQYRTVLGHFRHEIGHYYWPIIVGGTDLEDESRELFGDEREDYQAALQRHYENGPPADWMDAHVSAYATMHPAEDWAETFAHYLHIRDSVQTAEAYDLRAAGAASQPNADAAPRAVLLAWFALMPALNGMARSLGLDDPYPFVISPPVIEKLAFVERAVQQAADR